MMVGGNFLKYLMSLWNRKEGRGHKTSKTVGASWIKGWVSLKWEDWNPLTNYAYSYMQRVSSLQDKIPLLYCRYPALPGQQMGWKS